MRGYRVGLVSEVAAEVERQGDAGTEPGQRPQRLYLQRLAARRPIVAERGAVRAATELFG